MLAQINKCIVGTTDPSEQIVDVVTVGAAKQGAKQDFSADNEVVRSKRREAEINRKVMKDRVRLLSLEETMAMLVNARNALADALVCLKSGKLHFYIVIAATTRALICQQRGRSYPLLQRAAGLLDLPLLVYSVYLKDGIDKLIPNQPSLEIVSDNISIKAIYPSMVWLGLFGAQYEGRSYTNDEVIRAISDTQGAHFDPDVEPLVQRLGEFTVGLGGAAHSAAIRFLINAAEATIGLCDRTIAAGKSGG